MNAHQARLQPLIDRFRALATPAPEAPFDTSTHGEETEPSHLVIGTMVHGEECGTLPGVLAVMEDLAAGRLRVPGRVTFFLGNAEAGLANVRFLETDLNREFSAEPSDSHEGRRARHLKPLLDAADVFLDLHQTIQPSAEPFWIFPFQIPGWRWARAIAGAKVWITRAPDVTFSLSGVCADEYVRLAGKPGLTLELGEKGFDHGAEARAEDAIRRAIAIAAALADGASLQELAAREPEIAFFETVHREPFSDDSLALQPGLVNFQRVVAGQLLSAPGTPALRAPTDGAVVFPKYPPIVDGRYQRPLPAEIYRIIAPLSEHPLDAYGLRDAR
jgi:succinylglutamate desuccinylase